MTAAGAGSCVGNHTAVTSRNSNGESPQIRPAAGSVKHRIPTEQRSTENKEMGMHLTSLVISLNEATVLVKIQCNEGRRLNEVPQSIGMLQGITLSDISLASHNHMLRRHQVVTHQPLSCARKQTCLIMADRFVSGDVACKEIDSIHETWVWTFSRIRVLNRLKEASDMDVKVISLPLW